MVTDVNSELEAAAAHHRAGRFDAARAGYERVLALDPLNHQALDLLGVVYAFQGRTDESLSVLRRALDIAPNFPQALNHIGLILKSRHAMDEALDCFARAITIAPAFAEARINFGNILLEKGRIAEAIDSFQQAALAVPESALAHTNLGHALAEGGRRREAEASFRRAIAIEPSHAEANRALGEILVEAGRYHEAIPVLRRVIEVRPDDAGAMYTLGLALARCAEPALEAESRTHLMNAEALARKAVETLPSSRGAWEILGNILLRLGRTEEAFAARLRATSLLRSPDTHDFDHLATFHRASKSKLDHDMEQIRHLIGREAIKETYGAELLNSYQYVRDHLPNPRVGRLVELSAESRALIGATYNKLWHVAPAPELSLAAVNPALDRSAIEADYFGRAPGITWLDGFLTEDALTSLRRFCLESSVWFTDTYANGYLGAFAEDGFVCPLLLQIGRELPKRLPGIFGNHPLLKVWAFKYGQKPEGIALHADFAAINVNFWITPDNANLDPSSGGLVVWDKKAPPEWDFETYNFDHTAMKRHLENSGAVGHKIPHRQNRAVIFNSDLIHRTDEIHFRPGYENRRINITFLYGERRGRV